MRGGARISRQYLSDESLDRARMMLLAQLASLGALAHRYRDAPDVAYEMARDDDALSDVLGILLNEQRQRRFDDAEATTPGEGEG